MVNKLIKLVIVILVVNGMTNTIFGQKCKTDIIRQQNIAKNPTILDEIDRINQFTENWISDRHALGKPSAVVTIPVVVHVVWQNAEENISDEQIKSQFTVLNNDYRKLNSDASNAPAPFQTVAADVEIEFCLAKTDPQGNATEGITRTQTTVDNISEGEYYVTASGGKDPWDNTKYINIWICDMGDSGTLGFATPPGTATPIESDGMVIGPNQFGTTGTAANNVPNNLGRTVTHEMGHYFNLEHVWGPGDGGCAEDDFIDDTPLQEKANYDCPTFPLFDACTVDGNGVMFNNYLDYVDDNCMNMFSEGQKDRMLAALNGPRASLLTSTACSLPLSIENNESVEFLTAITTSPNPSVNYLKITISDRFSSENLHVKLYDLKGREHRSFSMRESKTINISNLAQGMYFLSFKEYPKANKKITITH